MTAQFQRIVCYICNDLVQKDFFRDHIALHIRYVPYSCQFEDCYSLFSSERFITLHSQQKHNGLNKIKCVSNENKEKLLNLLSDVCLKAPFTAEEKSALDKILRSPLFRKIVSTNAETVPANYMPGNIVSEIASKSNSVDTVVDNLQKIDKTILTDSSPQSDHRLPVKSSLCTVIKNEALPVLKRTVDGNVIVISPKLIDGNKNMISRNLVFETNNDSTCVASSSSCVIPYSSATSNSHEKLILKICLANPTSKHIKPHRHSISSYKRIFSSSIQHKLPWSIRLPKPNCTARDNCPSQNHKFSDTHSVVTKENHTVSLSDPVLQFSQMLKSQMLAAPSDFDEIGKSFSANNFMEQDPCHSKRIFQTIDEVIQTALEQKTSDVHVQPSVKLHYYLPKKTYHPADNYNHLKPDRAACKLLHLSHAKAKYGMITCQNCFKRLANSKEVLTRHAVSHLSQNSKLNWIYECCHCPQGQKRTAFRDTMITRHLRDKHNIKPSHRNIDYIDRSKKFADKIAAMYQECFPLIQNDVCLKPTDILNNNIATSSFQDSCSRKDVVDVKNILPMFTLPVMPPVDTPQKPNKLDDIIQNSDLDSLIHSIKKELPTELC